MVLMEVMVMTGVDDDAVAAVAVVEVATGKVTVQI